MDKSISRRALLGAAFEKVSAAAVLHVAARTLPAIGAASTVVACKTREALKPGAAAEEKVDEGPKFDEILAFVKEKYGDAVVEHKKLGDKVVIFFTDVHVKSVSELNLSRIDEVEKACDLQLVGRESSFVGPDSQQDQEISRMLDGILRIDPSKVLLRPQGGKKISTPGWSDYSPLWKDERFKTIGLETVETKLQGHLAAEIERIIDLFSDVAGAGAYMPLAHLGRFDVDVLRYLKIQEYFKNDPLFPKLDLSKFTRIILEDGFEAVACGPDDNQAVGMLKFAQMQWFDNRFIGPRNIIAVDKLFSEMQNSQFKRAAIVYGKAHSEKAQFAPDDSTIQELLADRGVSYIVINPSSSS